MYDGYELTIHGLLRKRAELAGEVTTLRDTLADKLLALDHLDASIRLFHPDIQLDDMPEKPAVPINAAFRGELQRFLLTALRKAPEPRTTLELGTMLMEARRLDARDRVLFKLVAGRVGHALARLRTKGWVESAKGGRGALLEWRATERPGEPACEWRNGSD